MVRWKDKVDRIKKIDLPSSEEIKYIYDIHHQVRIFDKHEYSEFSLEIKEDRWFGESADMHNIKNQIVELDESDNNNYFKFHTTAPASMTSNFDYFHKPLNNTTLLSSEEYFKDALIRSSIPDQNRKIIKKAEYFVDRYEHEIVDYLIKHQDIQLKEEIEKYASRYGRFINFSECDRKHSDPEIINAKNDQSRRDIHLYINHLNNTHIELSKIDNLIRTISMDKYNISKNQLFMNTIKNITSPITSSELNTYGLYIASK